MFLYLILPKMCFIDVYVLRCRRRNVLHVAKKYVLNPRRFGLFS